MKRVLATITVIASAGLFIGCSDPLEYKIVNATRNDVNVLITKTECTAKPKYKDDYIHERIVAAGSTEDYFETWGGGSRAQCLRVLDGTRRPLLEVPYSMECKVSSGGICYETANSYRIETREPASTAPLPFSSELPKRPYLDRVIDNVADEPLMFAVSIVTLLGILYGVILGIKALRNSRRTAEPAPREWS